jgi:hypothetical protein
MCVYDSSTADPTRDRPERLQTRLLAYRLNGAASTMIRPAGRSPTGFAGNRLAKARPGWQKTIWATLAAAPRLDAVFLELSVPNRLAELAATTGHLCPATFAAEIRKLERPVRWIVVHRKPRYAGEIARELAALEPPNVELVALGEPYSF